MKTPVVDSAKTRSQGSSVMLGHCRVQRNTPHVFSLAARLHVAPRPPATPERSERGLPEAPPGPSRQWTCYLT